MKPPARIVLLFFAIYVGSGLFASVIAQSAFGNSNVVDSAGPSRRPNVLLIGSEVIRADHVSCLGYFRNTTPTLDRLASEGVVFSKVIATSNWTLPTHMSIFTSLYTGVHKVTDTEKKLPKGIAMLAEILKANGYVTAGFVSSPVLDNRHGFSRGFDFYDDVSARLDHGLGLLGNETQNANMFEGAPTDEILNRVAAGWLSKNHDEPFFMWIFYFDAHWPYIPPPPFDTIFDPNYEGPIEASALPSNPKKMPRPSQRDLEHLIALYDGEILSVDQKISSLLKEFRKYRLLDDTLVIAYSDHGDAFYEHGKAEHGHVLYNEVIHVPLIVRWPATIAPDRQVSALVSQVDIMPTILDYLNIKCEGFMQGKSLRPLIEGRTDKIHDCVYAEFTETTPGTKVVLSAVINEDHKLIVNWNTRKKELYNLDNDPGEQINLYKEPSMAGIVPLENHLTRWVESNEKLHSSLRGQEKLRKVELDEDKLKQLRALGYVQ